MRPIDADSLIETIRKWYWDTDIQKAREDPCVVDVMIDLFIRTIIDSPTVGAEPTWYGRNISEYNPVDEFICSNCGLTMRDLQEVRIDEDSGDESYYEFEFSYCPRCGYEINKED